MSRLVVPFLLFIPANPYPFTYHTRTFTMATKTATKKNTKNPMPLLAKAQAVNPHKGGWNKDIAQALETELHDYLVAEKPIPDTLLNLLGDYGPLAGWKNVAKLIDASFSGTIK